MVLVVVVLFVCFLLETRDKVVHTMTVITSTWNIDPASGKYFNTGRVKSKMY